MSAQFQIFQYENVEKCKIDTPKHTNALPLI
jgi:hypothetical protein